jgi:hypothetical protein
MLSLDDFYNTIFKIEDKLYIASGSAPAKEKSWVRTCLNETHRLEDLSIDERIILKYIFMLMQSFFFNSSPVLGLLQV